MANNPLDRRDLEHMKNMVAYLQDYLATYDRQEGYQNYRLATLIDDVLYGLGMAIDPKQYSFAEGYDKFKTVLRQHLGITNVEIHPDMVLLPRRLTAENGAKYHLIGEFSEGFEREDQGEVYTQAVPVRWTTIKDIYKKIVDQFGRCPQTLQRLPNKEH